ncbi:MAG: chemotaxis response regulator protein-glutamate methylesterase [Nitrospirota bacterium]
MSIKVLVVDDSAFMRKTISSMLSSDDDIEVVGIAKNGAEAVEKVKPLDPDVVTLDIEMPVMNGLDALRKIMEIHPVPVLMLSSLTREGARETIKALEIGAFDYLHKNIAGDITGIVDIKEKLITKVKILAGKKPVMKRFMYADRMPPQLSTKKKFGKHKITIVAIGTSTGGPKALANIIPLIPKDFSACILIVQHMPKVFTGAFAERLNQISQIEVREAINGDIVRPGVTLIAPGGIHTKVVNSRDLGVEIELTKTPSGLLYTPSVDIMMLSVADVYSERALGVILTGMGSDGRDGMKTIKNRGGKTIVQDEDSSVVYGMPKAVVDIGAADKIAPVHEIAKDIIEAV